MYQAEPRRLGADEQARAISTWRYLRLAMIALALGLVVAVLVEWRAVPGHCFETSISAYFYTPARGALIGSLVGIGVCLFCLKGSSDPEDVLMNVAGMLAGVIALVPTPDAGGCRMRAASDGARDAGIANNVPALIAVALFSLAAIAGIAALSGRIGSTQAPLSRVSRSGFAASVVAFIASVIVFFADRQLFTAHAHDVAAFGMFGCVVAVVIFNAIAYPTDARSPRNPYTLTAIVMVTSLVFSLVAAVAGFGHWVIVAETAFILTFAAFWIIQTRELWHVGVRDDEGATPDPAPAAI